MNSKLKVATLGPEGTFSDKATEKILSHTDYIPQYTKTIRKVFEVLDSNADLGVVPVENMSEGFVQPTLDSLLAYDVSIIGEVHLSVQFSFVANVENIEDVKVLYVQPVALGQCSEFVAIFDNVTVIQTNSNIESLTFLDKDSNAGAIIPQHIFHCCEFATKIENVSDYKHNETRFLLIKKGEIALSDIDKRANKSSFIIQDNLDTVGILNFIASAFTKENINITSIISRPTKEAIGRYHFFIDIDGTFTSKCVQNAYNKIKEFYPIKFLGSYKKASL